MSHGRVQRTLISAVVAVAVFSSLFFASWGAPAAHAHGKTHTPYAVVCSSTHWSNFAKTAGSWHSDSYGHPYVIQTFAWANYDNYTDQWCGQMQSEVVVTNESAWQENFYEQANIHGLNVLHSVQVSIGSSANTIQSATVWSYVAAPSGNCQTFQGTVTNWSYIEQGTFCA